MDGAQDTLKQWVEESRGMVFFGGAGVSTESGIPDFRSSDGIFRRGRRIPCEQVVSRTFFRAHPAEFFDFYRNNLVYPQAKPNAAHLTLARWETEGKLMAVVTQNIDGLHGAAGSKNVLELHGAIHRNHCMQCGKAFGLHAVLQAADVPRCSCGGILKPDVVLYEEALDEQILGRSIEAIGNADLLLVGGTSLAVYPAAGLLRYYRGNRLCLINRSPTPYDDEADLVIAGSIGEVLGAL